MKKQFQKYLFSFIAILIPIFAISHEFPDSIQEKMASLNPIEKMKYLGGLNWELREKDRFLAIKCGEVAVHLADSLGEKKEKAQYCAFIGVTLLNYHFDAKAALTWFNKGFELALQNNDSIQIAYSYNNLGDIYSLNGNIPLAQAYADSSLYYFTKLDYKAGIAYSYINLGIVSAQQKDYSKALDYYKKAIDLFPEHQITNIVSTANSEAAKVHTILKNYDKALHYYREDLRLTLQIRNKTFQATALSGMANVLYAKRDYPQALELYNQSLVLFEEKKFDYGAISAQIGKALVYAKMGERALGEASLASAMQTAKRIAIPSKIQEVYKARLNFYDQLGAMDEQKHLIAEFITAYDSLFIVQQFETLNEIQKKHELITHLNEISTEYKNKKQETFYWLVLSILFIILIIVLFWRYYTNAKLNKELYLLNQGKDKLFSIISHDLRNPFIAIIQYLELLKEDFINEKNKKEFIDNLQVKTNNTFGLLDNLLNFSVFRNKKLLPHPEIIDTKALIKKIESTLDAQLSLKSLVLKTDLKAQLFTGDRMMMEIVLRNLISNAIKYSHKGTEILVRFYKTEEQAIFEITDSGIGMSEEIRKKLFSNIFNESNIGTNGETGTGIGLLICNEFVTLQHGTITIDSELGKGTTFSVYLPLES